MSSLGSQQRWVQNQDTGVPAAFFFVLGDSEDRVTWVGGPGEEGGAVLGVEVCCFWERWAEEA